MPTYQYECSECGLQEEIRHSIKQEFLTECPGCFESSFGVIITDVPLAFVKEIKTVGQLAEKNVKRLGKYQIDDIEEAKEQVKEKNNENFARKIEKQVEKGKLPKGTRVRKYQRHKKDEKVEKIMRMTPTQKKNYIETGKM